MHELSNQLQSNMIPQLLVDMGEKSLSNAQSAINMHAML